MSRGVKSRPQRRQREVAMLTDTAVRECKFHMHLLKCTY